MSCLNGSNYLIWLNNACLDDGNDAVKCFFFDDLNDDNRVSNCVFSGSCTVLTVQPVNSSRSASLAVYAH